VPCGSRRRLLTGLFVSALLAGAVRAAGESTEASFSFLVYGDSRSGDDCSGNAQHIALINRMSAETASFAFHTGDMISGYTNTTNWVQGGACTSPSSKGGFSSLVAPLASHAPAPGLPVFLFPVLGNHDGDWEDGWYPDLYGSGFCSAFNPQLFVPNHTTKSYFHANTATHPALSNGQFYSLACSVTNPAVYPDYMYYSFNYNGAHFLVLHIANDYTDLLDCNDCRGDLTDYEDYYAIHQLDFIKSDLAQARANPAIHGVFVLLHTPLFTTCDTHPANESWAMLSKLFSQYRVTAVFSGHCHNYERTVPVLVDATHPSGVQNDHLGTVYLVSGGGGSPSHDFNDPPGWFDVSREVVNHYLRVTVNNSNTTVAAIDENGVTFDSASWTSMCTTSPDCNDGLACNGVETCVAGSCQPGGINLCPPAAVVGLRLSHSGSQLALQWNSASGAAVYRIYTDTVASGPFVTPNPPDVTGTSVLRPLPSGRVFYKVVAVTATGIEGPK
jgi:hypothetical protein